MSTRLKLPSGGLLVRERPADTPALMFDLPIGTPEEKVAGVIPSEGKQHIRCATPHDWVDAGVVRGQVGLIYIGHDIGQPLLSDDFGVTTRRPRNDGLHAYATHSVVGDPWDPNFVVALMGNVSTEPSSQTDFAGLYTTDDLCETWTPRLTRGDVTAKGYPGVPFDSRVQVDPFPTGGNPNIRMQQVITCDPTSAVGGRTQRWWFLAAAGHEVGANTNVGPLFYTDDAFATIEVAVDCSALGAVQKIERWVDPSDATEYILIASSRKGLCRYNVDTDTLTENWRGTNLLCLWFEVDVDDPDIIVATFNANSVQRTTDGGGSWTTLLSGAASVIAAGAYMDRVPGGAAQRVLHLVGDVNGANGTCNQVSTDSGATWAPWLSVTAIDGARPGADGQDIQPHKLYCRLIGSTSNRFRWWGGMNAHFWRCGYAPDANDFTLDDPGDDPETDPRYWHFSDQGWTGINMNRGGMAATVEDPTEPGRIAFASTDVGAFVSDDAAESFEWVPEPSGLSNSDAKAIWTRPGSGAQFLWVAYGRATSSLYRTSNRGGSWTALGSGGGTLAGPFIDFVGTTGYWGTYRSTNNGTGVTETLLAAPYAAAEFLAVNADGTTWRWIPNGADDTSLLWRGAWATPTLLTGWAHSLRVGGADGLVRRIVFATPKDNADRFWTQDANGDLARVTVAPDGSTTWVATGLLADIKAAAETALGLTPGQLDDFPLHLADVAVDPTDSSVVYAVVLESGIPPLWRITNAEAAAIGNIVVTDVSDKFPRVGRGTLGVLASRGDLIMHSQAGEKILAPPTARDEPSLTLGPATYQFS